MMSLTNRKIVKNNKRKNRTAKPLKDKRTILVKDHQRANLLQNVPKETKISNK